MSSSTSQGIQGPRNGGRRPDAFISYARAQRGYAVACRDMLEALGYDVWLDLDDLATGSRDYAEWAPIVEAINGSRVFLFLWSEAALRSPEVWFEFGRTQAKGEAKEVHGGGVSQRHRWEGVWPDKGPSVRPIRLDAAELVGNYYDLWEGKGKIGPLQIASSGEPARDPMEAAWWAAIQLTDSLGKDHLEEVKESSFAHLKRAFEAVPATQPADAAAWRDVLTAFSTHWLAVQGVAALDPESINLDGLNEAEPSAEWDALSEILRAALDAPLGDRTRGAFLDLVSAVERKGSELADLLKLFGEKTTPDGPPVEDQGAGDAGAPAEPKDTPTSYMISPPIENDTTLEGVLQDPSRLAFFIGPEAVHVRNADEDVAYPQALVYTAGERAKDFVVEANERIVARVDKKERRADNYAWPEDIDEIVHEYVSPFFTSTKTVTLRGRRSHPGCVLPPAIVQAQAALLVLSMVATEVFVVSHSSKHTAIDGWAERAELDARERIFLEVASERARDAWKAAKDECGGSESEQSADWPTRLGVDHLIAALDGAKFRKYLEFGRVEWYADMLWHSLVVFGSRDYPTSYELATQVAMGTKNVSTIRREAYRRIWAARDLNLVRDRLRLALERPLRSTPTLPTTAATNSARKLYGAIAMNAVRQFESGSIRPGGIIVSSGFDMEAELALAKTGRPFHLIFPVLKTESPNAVRGEWRWAIADYKPRPLGESKEIDIEWLLRPEEVHLIDRHYSQTFIEGPIVLKIAGAPLLRFPGGALQSRGATQQPVSETGNPKPKRTANAEARSSTQGGPDHGRGQNPMPLAVGDYDQMQFLMIDLAATAAAGLVDTHDKPLAAGAMLPVWIRHGLQRYNWLAIGVSDEEWNARMQLFYYRTRKNAGFQGFFAALFESENHARDQLLAVCGIAPLKHDPGQPTDLTQLQELAVKLENALSQ